MQTNIASTSTNATMQLAKVVPVNINDHLCYPKFNCIHLNFPGQEQLKRNLARYRQKDVLIHLFEHANNFDASDEELHSKLAIHLKTRRHQNCLGVHQHDYSEFRWSRILD